MNLYFGTTSMNPELWPATGSIAKKYAESQVTKTLPNIVQYPGTLGPTRNGWFFDPSSLSEDLKADPFTSLAMIEEKGGFTPGHANAFTLSQELGVGNFNIAYHTFADGVASGFELLANETRASIWAAKAIANIGVGYRWTTKGIHLLHLPKSGRGKL